MKKFLIIIALIITVITFIEWARMFSDLFATR